MANKTRVRAVWIDNYFVILSQILEDKDIYWKTR